MRLRSRTRVFALSAVALASLIAIPATTADAHGRHRRPKEVSVQILSLNDFHGQLEVVNPTASSGGRIGALAAGACTPPGCYPAGGVEYLATHVRNLRAENRNTVFASAGDLIGATPLLSALFHDEPTIEAFNMLGLDYNGVGNHEFDEGIDELLRMQYGNLASRLSPRAGTVAIRSTAAATAIRSAAPSSIPRCQRHVQGQRQDDLPALRDPPLPGGVKVAFVGMTLEGTPLIVSPDGIASVDFLDEAESVNALVPHLKRAAASRRSSSCCTKAAARRTQAATRRCQQLQQPHRCAPADRRSDGRRDRHRDHGSHQLGGQLPDRRQGRDRRRLAGTSDHRHRRHDQHADHATSPRSSSTTRSSPRTSHRRPT